MLPIIAEEVEAKAIVYRVSFSNERCAEADPLRRIHHAFEDRILDALTMILAQLSYTPQPALAFLISCADIVADQDQYCLISKEMQDRRRNRRGYAVPGAMPAHRVRGQVEFVHEGRDARSLPACVPATRR